MPSFQNKPLDKKLLKEILNQFAHQKILVIGDLMLDVYIKGVVDRISPEAPVPVLIHQSENFRMGGAGNVALNLRTLGAEVYLSGMIGEDKDGDELLNLLDQHIINTDLIVKIDSLTTVKTRVIADQQQVVRIDREKKREISDNEIGNLIERINRLAVQFDAIIVSDYGKGMITEEGLIAIKSYAKKNEVFLAVDPKERNFPIYQELDLMTPNSKEAAYAGGLSESESYDLLELGQKIMNQHCLKHLLITRGKNGMAIFDKSIMVSIPTYSQDVFDVSGAGDTVISTFVLAFLVENGKKNNELEIKREFLIHAAILANLAAGVVVSKFGTSTVAPGEIIDFLNTHQEVLEDINRKIEKIEF